MNEAYLHFIWKLKRLPFHQMKTTNGKEIQILNCGIHNVSESGPDFSNARIFYEQMEWAGQIEMHVKSSDWYRHNHHLDAAYNNVILHVVYEHDKEISVNNSILPTIELKSFIDKDHFKNWETFAKSMKDIHCEDSIHSIDSIYLKAMIHRAFIERINRKVDQVLYLSDQTDNQSMLYTFIAKAFGTKINEVPFELLANRLPLSLLKRLNSTKQRQLLLHVSGLYDEILDETTTPLLASRIQPELWKHKGLRPSSFPEKRVMQFTNFVASCDFELLAEYYTPKESYEYIKMLSKKKQVKDEYQISENLIDLLFINAFFPFYWYKSQIDSNEKLQNHVIEVMEAIKPESNFVLKKWNKIGISAANSYESQALIELYNEYCNQKKCLKCQVGIKILKEGDRN